MSKNLKKLTPFKKYRKWLTDKPNITWDEVKVLMLKHFTASNYEDNLTKQLDNLKFTDLFKYIADFQFIMNQLKDIPDRMQVYIFKKNLPTHLHNEVEYKQPKTLQEAVELAQSYNQSHPAEIQINYSQPAQWCTNHHSNTHSTQDCRMKTNRQYDPRNQRYKTKNNDNKLPFYQNPCSNNQSSRSSNWDNKSKSQHKPTHYNHKNNQQSTFQNKEAPERIKTNYQTNRTKPTYSIETIMSNNTIKQVDQVIVELEIASLSSPDDSNLLTSTAFINNINMPIIIDTGAGQSIIPSVLVDQFKFKTHKSNITCKFGDNS